MRRLGVFVSWVVNVRGSLFVFVFRVCFYGFFLWIIIRDIGIFGVGDGGWNLIIIFFVILIFRFLGFGVGDSVWFINELVFRYGSFFVDNFEWSVFILVFGFGGFRVRNVGLVNLVFWFFVIGVFNFFWRVE